MMTRTGTAMLVLAIAAGCSSKVTHTASSSASGSGGAAGAGGRAASGAGGSAPVCPAAAKVCAGICTDVAFDPSNCGGCGQACPMGQVCSQGQCAVSCGGGTKLCNGACADVAFDPSNCGGCAQACPMGQVCSQGQCGCAANAKKCGGACVDVALDPNNCGDCGKSCGSGGFCHDGECNCGQSQALAAKSCSDIRARCANVQSGPLWISPDATPINVHCEMALSGGGWTQFLQCLPADACTFGNTVVYNTDWTTADFGATSDSASFLLGKSLATVVNGSTMFMVVVTDTNQNKTAQIIYPLNSDTRNFFSTNQPYYATGAQQATIIDFDNTQTARLLGLCWAPQNSPFARSYQGAGGVSFLGNVTAAPSATPNSGCDYGPWAAQMLIRNPAVSDLSTSWGISPVNNWQAQPYAHRLYVK